MPLYRCLLLACVPDKGRYESIFSRVYSTVVVSLKADAEIGHATRSRRIESKNVRRHDFARLQSTRVGLTNAERRHVNVSLST
jgi:hypothetical protein